MKKIIYVLGIAFLLIVVVLNLLFTTRMDVSEHTRTTLNYFVYSFGIILLGFIIFAITQIINKLLYNDVPKSKSKIRKWVLAITLVVYALFNIVWVILVNPGIGGDSVHVANLAQVFYRGNAKADLLDHLTYIGIPLREYMQSYPHQISLAFIFSLFYRAIHLDLLHTLRIINVIGNVLIVIALYKINSQISKKYKTNKVLLLTLITTFISLVMLNTFIYGDIFSLALCLFSIYFMMRYTETKKLKYPAFASICTMIAYIMRMNSLIFIIATVIYLVLNLFKEISKNKCKENILQVLIILTYVIISILPNTIVQNYYFEKYNLDKSKIYPSISYILMAMEESPRGNGWYSENIAEPAIKNPENAKEEYIEKIKDRLTYLSQNLGYAFNFYTMKIASMWTENTYSATMNNSLNENEMLMFYQKALLVLMCICSIIVLIQNRKNISLELIFLVTIFIGGFAFHILWEAKSRYIIPYIVILIPISAIEISTKYYTNKGKCDKIEAD